MAREHDDERPKKSWREIDATRDRSGQRTEEKPGGQRQSKGQRSQAYSAYKSQLNKMFDTGELPEALKSKLADAGLTDASDRKAAVAAIRAASGLRPTLAALAAYRDQYGFPEDEEVLAKLLDLDDEAVVLEAVQTAARLLDEGRLKRGASLKARLKTVQMMIDDPEVQSAARALLARLR